MTKPIVAIVGRQNVGKSTLFNRIVGEDRAIVEDAPGTTRDRVYADTSWRGLPFTIVDTGGLEPDPSSDISQRVKEQVEVAIAEADAIIFLVDVVDGVTHTDHDIANMLRRTPKPVVLAANKADNPKREAEAVQFYELSIGDPIPISAYHGTGTGELLDRVTSLLPSPPPTEEVEERIRVAIVGRRNVGKSTLLNAILGEERAIVSEIPGTTRDAIDTPLIFDNQPMLLIDTAGIRRRGRVEMGIEHYSVIRALRAISRADVALLVTDATEEATTAQDMHIAGYIRQAFKGIVLVVNKWDLARERDVAQYTQMIRKKLCFMPYVPILFTSAKFGEGVDKVLPTAKKVFEERAKRLSTPQVNSVVSEAVVSHSPPTVAGRRLRILYATQAETSPPTFVFFVNDPKLVHFSYQRYLENKLRDAFGFAGTPLRLIFKSRREG